jgi:hypothetical protein
MEAILAAIAGRCCVATPAAVLRAGVAFHIFRCFCCFCCRYFRAFALRVYIAAHLCCRWFQASHFCYIRTALFHLHFHRCVLVRQQHYSSSLEPISHFHEYEADEYRACLARLDSSKNSVLPSTLLSRGRGNVTSRSSTIRPGRRLSTTTRSASKTASATL